MILEIKIEKNKIFCPLKNDWLIATPEEIVRQKIIVKLVNNYGYSLEQMEQEVNVANANRGQGKARADVVIWKSKVDKLQRNKAFIVVECKAENLKIRQEDYFQGLNYATWAGAIFFITTNEKETKFFKVINEKIHDEVEEIIDIPNFSIINDEKKITDLLAQTKVFSRDEFSKLLFKCHCIIRNNDKLDPAVAFDEISKI